MSRSETPLSNVLADVASAVVSTQKELDAQANRYSGGLPLAPLAFVVKQTDVTLLGNLSVQRSDSSAAQDRALNFALVNRVQAGLRGSGGAALSSRVSVSIQAIEPPHGD
jgi:hypothetical protein